MRPIILFSSTLFLLLLFFANARNARAQSDYNDAKDYPGIDRVAGYYISDYYEEENGIQTFYTSPTADSDVEGKKIYYEYTLKEGNKAPAKSELFKYFFAQFEGAGGKVVFEDLNDNVATFKFSRGGKEAWASLSLFDDGGYYTLTFIETK